MSTSVTHGIVPDSFLTGTVVPSLKPVNADSSKANGYLLYFIIYFLFIYLFIYNIFIQGNLFRFVTCSNTGPCLKIKYIQS